ncbi:MAG: hypothetical protein Q9160_006704 [Pyrenula sp. 1 TL-2023]
MHFLLLSAVVFFSVVISLASHIPPQLPYSTLTRRLTFHPNCQDLDLGFLSHELDIDVDTTIAGSRSLEGLWRMMHITIRGIAHRAAGALGTPYGHQKFIDYFGRTNLAARKRSARRRFGLMVQRGPGSQDARTMITCRQDRLHADFQDDLCFPRAASAPILWARPAAAAAVMDIEMDMDMDVAHHYDHDQILLCPAFYRLREVEWSVIQDDKVTSLFHASLILASQRVRGGPRREEMFEFVMPPRLRADAINQLDLFTAFAMAVHKGEDVGRRWSQRRRGPPVTFEDGTSWLDN